MHDLSYFRTNLDAVAARLADRSFTLDVAAFRALDEERRAALTQSEQFKAQRNAETQEIGKLRKAGEDTTARQLAVREMGEKISALEDQAKSLDDKFREILAGVPNVPHESVPVGKSAEDNVEVRRVSTPPQFDFPGKTPLGSRPRTRQSRFRASRQNQRRPF